VSKPNESIEHARLRNALAEWFTAQGLSKVKTPADEAANLIPDVQADFLAKMVYGEAKLCEDFPGTDTKQRLIDYCDRLPSEYKLVVGVPRACEAAVQRMLTEWGLTQRIQLVAL
jgi:hypothetical protein